MGLNVHLSKYCTNIPNSYIIISHNVDDFANNK